MSSLNLFTPHPLLFILVTVLVISCYGVAQPPHVSDVSVKQLPRPITTFPPVIGRNLNRVDYSLPEDFEGQFNLIFLAFSQAQQNEVDTWLPFAKTVEENLPSMYFYEIPTLTKANGLFRNIIEGGMRSGIKDPEARARTITLYLDRTDFLRNLGVSSTSSILTLLVEKEGDVLWMTEGTYTDEKARNVYEIINLASQHDQ